MKAITLLIGFIMLYSCSSETKEHQITLDKNKLEKQIEKVQKPAIVMESDMINAYIKNHAYSMQTGGSGLRYQIIKTNPKGKQIKTMNVVKVNYKVSLLNGSICYNSEIKGPKTFKVDMDNVESGIHEGVKLMKEGEKAIFILPSHLAHGVTGDNDKIPPKAAVVYELEVLSVKP